MQKIVVMKKIFLNVRVGPPSSLSVTDGFPSTEFY